jgi:guanosine-3',5'-bis(diphosphate) 3'-pyrophosphohydrolase
VIPRIPHPELDARHARLFAVAAHAGQRYGKEPYVFHLDRVANLCIPYGTLATVTAYLHDVLEDTRVMPETLAEEFGGTVCDLVMLVTDEDGFTRAERKAATNAKLRDIPAGGPLEFALIVKAADRLANLVMSASEPMNGKFEMYRCEHAAFEEAVRRKGVAVDLWSRIDGVLKH